jgi:hypothetical protein
MISQGITILILLTCTQPLYAGRFRQKGLAELYLRTVQLALTGTLLETDAYEWGIGNETVLKRIPFNEDARRLGRIGP